MLKLAGGHAYPLKLAVDLRVGGGVRKEGEAPLQLARCRAGTWPAGLAPGAAASRPLLLLARLACRCCP